MHPKQAFLILMMMPSPLEAALIADCIHFLLPVALSGSRLPCHPHGFGAQARAPSAANFGFTQPPPSHLRMSSGLGRPATAHLCRRCCYCPPPCFGCAYVLLQFPRPCSPPSTTESSGVSACSICFVWIHWFFCSHKPTL